MSSAKNHIENEELVLKFWQEADIFNKTLEKKAPQGDYVFYDGPPFATGTPHYGHIVASVMKDIVPRYQTMRGYHVERKWGWDCHGLPIENIVEKELDTKSKKDIENLGVAKFNDLCRSKVSTYVDEWEKVITRLGRWADFKNAYKTMDLNFMDSIWWAFKELWKNDLIYKDYRSMHICPRCETTLSQSEVTEGYRDVKDLSVIAKFELVAEPGTFVLAWTTTPWTLIGNVALAVGKEIMYVKVKLEDDENLYILAKERIADILKEKKYEIVDTFEGLKLIGKSYKPLFDYYSSDEKLVNRENGWKIYAADFVTTTDGVGIVHIAPAFGEDDMKLGKENNLPFIQHVGMDGLFKEEVKDFPGLHVKPIADHTSTDVAIIKYLAAHGTLFSKEKYEHSYPHCWRCDTPLINYATSSWFVGVTRIKQQLLESAKFINWSPDYLKEGRFGNWLEGARDWSISRQRFWASPIPIWECACGAREVIGSVIELEKLTGEKIDDIHKDKIDHLTFTCPDCGAEMKRIPDVLDCWFESGSMPFAQLHYPFENKEKFDENFPAQFIAEGVDQTRAWFYYLHVISGGIFQSHSFQNVMVNGIVLAEDGKKMAKRLKNYPDPYLVMEKYGSDALRAYLTASPVMQAENLNFSEKGVEEALRKNIMLLNNIYKFYELFAADLKQTKIKEENVLDSWILIKLNSLIEEVTKNMEAYNLPKSIRPITEFIDEFSTWYLRRSRDRFKSDDEKDKQNALATTKHVFIELSKIMAPFMPFIAESLWQDVNGYNFNDINKSVHLEKWPEPLKLKEIEGSSEEFSPIIRDMNLVKTICNIGAFLRDKSGIKVRQILSELKYCSHINDRVLSSDYLKLIEDELNVSRVVVENDENYYKNPGENWIADDSGVRVALNILITPELKQEGIKRDLVRLINMNRKDNGFTLSDSAIIYFSGLSDELKKALQEKFAEIKNETLSFEINLVETFAEGLVSKEIKIDDCKFFIAIKKK